MGRRNQKNESEDECVCLDGLHGNIGVNIPFLELQKGSILVLCATQTHKYSWQDLGSGNMLTCPPQIWSCMHNNKKNWLD